MIFVTHDLGVIADVADEVVVMYAGQIVEHTAAASLFARPRHPYTEALLDSIPQLTPAGRALHAIPGMVPRPTACRPGCRFAPAVLLRAATSARSAPVALAAPSTGCLAARTVATAPVEPGPVHPPGRAGALGPTTRADLGDGPERADPATHRTAEPIAPCSEVTGLSKDFPIRSGRVAADDGDGQGRRRRRSPHTGRDDTGPGRRERFGQVDTGPPGARG